jgi:hypothetical protein
MPSRKYASFGAMTTLRSRVVRVTAVESSSEFAKFARVVLLVARRGRSPDQSDASAKSLITCKTILSTMEVDADFQENPRQR